MRAQELRDGPAPRTTGFLQGRHAPWRQPGRIENPGAGGRSEPDRFDPRQAGWLPYASMWFAAASQVIGAAPGTPCMARGIRRRSPTRWAPCAVRHRSNPCIDTARHWHLRLAGGGGFGRQHTPPSRQDVARGASIGRAARTRRERTVGLTPEVMRPGSCPATAGRQPVPPALPSPTTTRLRPDCLAR